MSNKRGVLVLALIAIGAVVGFFALRGNFPPTSGTEGAIGAAQRYQSDQIGASDVTVTDAQIQAFLQSDVFHKITTNPEYRSMIAHGDFQKVVADADMARKDREKGFLSKILTFWKTDDKEKPEQYRIKIVETAPQSTVSVQDPSGNPDRSQVSERILALLRDQLK